MAFQIGIYHMTIAGFLAGLENAGRTDPSASEYIIRKGAKENQYELVGQLNVDNLDEAFYHSQNIDESWTVGEKVSYLPKTSADGCRSSMVGDIFVMNGDAYVVASRGFNKLMQGTTNLILNSTGQGTVES